MLDLIRNIALFLAILPLMGCGDGNYNEPSPTLNPTIVPESKTEDSFMTKWVGSWHEWKFVAPNVELVRAYEGETLIFNDDGTWEVNNPIPNRKSIKGIYQVFAEQYLMTFLRIRDERDDYIEKHTQEGTWNLNGDTLILIGLTRSR